MKIGMVRSFFWKNKILLILVPEVIYGIREKNRYSF